MPPKIYEIFIQYLSSVLIHGSFFVEMPTMLKRPHHFLFAFSIPVLSLPA